MFFLCVNIINIKKINRIFELIIWIDIKEASIELTNSLAEFITSTVKDENIEDTEEYLNINDTTIHVIINKKNNCIDKAPITPKYVATPFPPLNFNHTGKICPKKTTSADK